MAQLEETRRVREDLRLSRLKEEELNAQIAALQLAPDSQRTIDVTHELAKQREATARAARDNAALAESLADSKRRHDHVVAENERLKVEYMGAVEGTTKAEMRVMELYRTLEESRLTTLADSNAAAAAERELSALKTQALINASSVDVLKSELAAASSRPGAITPAMPTAEASLLVDAMRAELDAKKAQLSRSQAMLLSGSAAAASAAASAQAASAISSMKSISPSHRRSQADLWDISPARPVSPPAASSPHGFVSPSSPSKKNRSHAKRGPGNKLSPMPVGATRNASPPRKGW